MAISKDTIIFELEAEIAEHEKDYIELKEDYNLAQKCIELLTKELETLKQWIKEPSKR